MILSPELDLTNSLLINRPVGNVILRPFGALSSTFRSAILSNIGRVDEKDRTAAIEARYLHEFKDLDLRESSREPANNFNM